MTLDAIDHPSTTTPDPRPLRVLIITGSIRDGRFGPVPAAWAAERARERDGLHVEVADLAEYDLPLALAGENGSTPEAVARLGRQIEAADAIVIVTPVYNRGYPASLKNAIDWFHSEWAATPVGFVSYGGRTGGIEAVEQLRGVFVELGTMTIRHVLSFPNFWESFDDTGAPVAPEPLAQAATAFYDQLTWWGRALRTARTQDPA